MAAAPSRTSPVAGRARCARLVLVAASVTACSAEEQGTASLQRLQLAVVPGSPPVPLTRTVASFDLLAEPERWMLAAGDTEQAVPRDLARSPEGEMLRFGLPADGQLRLSRAGSYDPASFSEVRLTIVSGGTGRVGASFLRGGEVVASAPSRPVPVGTHPGIVELLLSEAAAAAAPCDALLIQVEGELEHVFLRHVELVDRPIETRLPDPAAGASLVGLDGDGRRGAGLSRGRPLEAEVVVPARGVLSFSFAQAPLARAEGPPLQLEVTVRGHQGSVAGELFVVPSPRERPVWLEGRMPLTGLAGQRASVRFELDADGSSPVACVIAEAAVWSRGEGPPSVLLVTSDTHRADHLGAATGAVPVATPVLDELARSGVLFEDCFATTNVTNPSHMALLTGAHPRDIGIFGNNHALGPDVPTLAARFAAGGYVTRAVLSAQHLGDPESGLGQGFDRMSWPKSRQRPAEETIDIALDALSDLGDRPVFLWVHLFDAHTPYEPPADVRARYYPRGKDPFDPSLPPTGLDDAALPPELAGLRDLDFPAACYKGEVSSLDDELGRLLSRRRFRQGVVAVTADHGESLGQHGIHYTHAGLYPDSLHVPLLLSWPSGPRGLRVAGPVSQLDLGPTLLELAGLSTDGVPGRSLLEQLDAGPFEGPPRFALASHRFSASVTWRGLHLMLQLQAEQHRFMSRAFERHQVQLYDLSADPRCERDLVDGRQPEATALRARLIAWLVARQPLGWSGAIDERPETLQRLAELGYLDEGGAGGARAAGGDEGAEALWEPDDCEWCRRFGG